MPEEAGEQEGHEMEAGAGGLASGAAAHVAGVEHELDAHVRALRRKLERAARRGEPTAHIEARLRGEEELLRRMRGARGPQGADERSVA